MSEYANRIFHSKRDMGLTGETRHRRQAWTGKYIMQVEVVREITHSQRGVTIKKTYGTYYRDAGEHDIVQIAAGYGFITVPETWTPPRPQGPHTPPPKAP